jgi:hypothetical protein
VIIVVPAPESMASAMEAAQRLAEAFAKFGTTAQVMQSRIQDHFALIRQMEVPLDLEIGSYIKPKKPVKRGVKIIPINDWLPPVIASRELRCRSPTAIVTLERVNTIAVHSTGNKKPRTCRGFVFFIDNILYGFSPC